MADIGAELKALRLYGMSSAWSELSANDTELGLQSARGLIERLLQAESTDRAMRPVVARPPRPALARHGPPPSFPVDPNST